MPSLSHIGRWELRLCRPSLALVNAHDIKKNGHAVHAFAQGIASRGGVNFDNFSVSPAMNIEAAIEELVKWKTALQCGHSHHVSKGYFIDAEPVIELQWNQIIFPLIRDLDFTSVLDLACGHGRNSEYLRHYAKEIHLVDINQSCIDACRERFSETKDGVQFHYHVTDGNHLKMINNESITLVYTWDSMVHFDKLIVRDYMKEIGRVLKVGGTAFLHHSNYGEKAPDSNWANNSGTRSDMSGSLMRQYAQEVGLRVVTQKIQGRAEGWGEDGLDCVSILSKQ
jgi:ubiquinone/menaquinone biosynthesis C-methylase UbiE